MMEKRVIRVDSRPLETKHSVKEIRKHGFVPGMLYGKQIGNIPVQVAARDLTNVGGAHLVEVTLPGGTYPAVIREIQKNSLDGSIRHVDFQQVEMDKPITAEVVVHVTGTPKGLNKGGALQMGERTVEIEALPNEMPDLLEADITNLGIGDKYTVADLQKTTPYRITSDLHTLLAVVINPGQTAQEA